MNMNVNLFLTGLLAISLFTNITVQAIKNLTEIKMPTVVAAITSVILAAIGTVGYILYFNIAVTIQVVIEGIALAYLSFLSATCGYDVVMKALKQIFGDK